MNNRVETKYKPDSAGSADETQPCEVAQILCERCVKIQKKEQKVCEKTKVTSHSTDIVNRKKAGC